MLKVIAAVSAAHQVVNLHETEGECDIKRIGRVANWTNAIVVVSEQIAKQSFFIAERRRRR